MSRLAESSPTSDIRCHGSVVVRCVPRSSRHPLPAPRRVRRPARSAARGHVLSDVPHRLGRARFRQPEGSRAFRVQTPVIVPIPRCAYRELERLPSLEVHARSRTTRWLTSRTPRSRGAPGSGSSPSTMLALTRRQLESGARQARSPHLTVARTRRSRGSRLRALVRPLGSADGGDPGRHRPMSATHDFVFKTGTHSSRHTPLGVPAPRGGLALHGALGQPRRSRPRHEGLFVPRSVSARTEDASSPAGFPAERDSRVHRRSRGARMPASTRGSPRWSRPVSPRRVNDVGSCRWSEASSAPAACRSPTLGARSALAASDRFEIESTGRLEFPSDGRSSAVSCQPARGAFTASVPTLAGRCPPPSREAPPAGDRCGPRFAALEVPASGVAEAPPSPRSPASPLSDTLVTAPGSARVGLPPSFRCGRDLRDPEGPFRSGAFPHRHVPDRSRSRAVHRERCAKCLLDRGGRGPVTGLPPTSRLDSRWAANPPPGAAASRWLLRPKTRKLVFATFEGHITRRARDGKRKTTLKRDFFLHRLSTSFSTPRTRHDSQTFHSLSTGRKFRPRTQERYIRD